MRYLIVSSFFGGGGGGAFFFGSLTLTIEFQNNVTGAEIEVGVEALQRSADAVRQAYADIDPDLRDAMNQGRTPVINISVSFDGTWQKRGFTSLYGVGICIDVLTGLVVDYHVMSKYCHACQLKQAAGLTAADLEEWRQTMWGEGSAAQTTTSPARLWNKKQQKS